MGHKNDNTGLYGEHCIVISK